MKTRRLVAVLLGLATLAFFAADASAMYHPTMGRFMQRDPGSDAGAPARIGVGGPNVGGHFLPRDPDPQSQYRDGMSLYEYGRSRPVIVVDPQGEAVIFFGGGMELPGTGGMISSGPIFTPIGFRIAAVQIGGLGPFGGMPGEDAKVFGYRELKEAKQWLKSLPADKKCEVRIVGHSTGCSSALQLAQEVASSPAAYGVSDGSLKKLIFYDFNWGAASHPDYAPPNFNKPKGNYQYQHVISTGNVTLDPSIPYTSIPLLPIPLAGGMPIANWTQRLWTEIPFRKPSWWEYLKYNASLGNTSGAWTATYTAPYGGGWLTPTAWISGVDHYMLGSTYLAGPSDVMARLFP